jgi:hypothetical protein
MRRTALVALALLAAVGCGGNGKAKTNADETPSASLTGSASTTPSASGSVGPSGSAGTSGSPGTTTAPPASGGASTSPGTKPSSGTPSGPPPTANGKLEAKLTKSCVTRGGVQTLSIDTYPDMFVVFDTEYSDKKDGQVYGGFESNGRSDGNGHYQKTWVVAPTAPLGDARVDMAIAGKYKGDNKTAVRQLHFKVATSC